MKIVPKIITSGLLTLIFLSMVQRASAQSDTVPSRQKSLEFQIMFSKESYEIDEPILCFMYLKNLSEDSVTVKSRMAVNSENEPHDVFFRVYDPTGERLPFWPEVKLPSILRPYDFETVSTGGFITQLCQLDHMFKIELTGTYQIQAVYSNWLTIEGVDAWTGKLVSNRVEIQIQEKEEP